MTNETHTETRDMAFNFGPAPLTDEHLTADMAETDILALIERYQNVQKTNKCGSAIWNQASALLQPLFAEMARRQNAGLLNS